MTEVKSNMVNHPAHYIAGKYEVIDILEDKLSADEFIGFLKGNILKYQLRASYKGSHLQDLEKAHWYSNKLIEFLQNKEESTNE